MRKWREENYRNSEQIVDVGEELINEYASKLGDDSKETFFTVFIAFRFYAFVCFCFSLFRLCVIPLCCLCVSAGVAKIYINFLLYQTAKIPRFCFPNMGCSENRWKNYLLEHLVCYTMS